MYKYHCGICGARLDPGEHCDCQETHERNLAMVDEFLTEDQDGQMVLKEATKNGTYTRL